MYEQIIKDFAKEHSFTFTCKALGFHPYQLGSYKHLFTPRKVGYIPRPHMTQRNLANAPKYDGYTVSQLADITGRSKSTIRQRIKAGWSMAQIMSKAKHNGNQANFCSNRNNKTWRDKIHAECEEANRKRDAKAGRSA